MANSRSTRIVENRWRSGQGVRDKGKGIIAKRRVYYRSCAPSCLLINSLASSRAGLGLNALLIHDHAQSSTLPQYHRRLFDLER